MAFLTTILEWIAGQILAYLLGKATSAIEQKAADVERDKARGEVNDANVKAYEEANDRADRIRAATDLLNRTKRV